MTTERQLRDALEIARQFIDNGIEMGYIKMPMTRSDPAHKTPGIIREALALPETPVRTEVRIRYEFGDPTKPISQVFSMGSLDPCEVDLKIWEMDGRRNIRIEAREVSEGLWVEVKP